MGTVDKRLSLWLAAGSMPGSLGGIYALERLHDAHGNAIDDPLLVAIAVAVLLTGSIVLARAIFMPGARDSEREHAVLDRRSRLGAVAVGLVVGFMIGATSVGSGAVVAVVLILAFRLTPRRVVGTDIFHAAILLWVAALAHLASGNVDVVLGLTMLAGSLPGVWLGSHLAGRLPEMGLRVTLGAVLLVAGLGLLEKAGAGIPVLALVGGPVVLVVLGWVARGRLARRTVVGST
jgi:uncharacterized membrane protein YfcA